MPEIRTSTPLNYDQQPGQEQTSPNAPPATDNNQDSPKAQESPERSRKIRNIISTISLFLAAPLFALFLILFVIQSYEVDGPSMENTLQDKDLLIVDKSSKTWSRITGNPYIPERGEIIIFTKNENLGFGGQNRQLVKRVIALPGEKISVNDGVVTVYNNENPDGFKPDENPEYNESAKIEYTQGAITMQTVPENHVFVMGDNRNNSLDSRSFGPVNVDEIVGSLGLRLFPLNTARRF